jgi:hypothetical protein
LKPNALSLAVAALTFALSLALVYFVYGAVQSIFDDLLPAEEEYHHCSQ